MSEKNISDLASKSCKTCVNGAKALAELRIQSLLTEVVGWTRKGGEIVKTFNFANYHETMAFVNATAWISHREDHHPDLEVGYNKVAVRYSTHSAGGLTENDFICAAKIDELLRM
ncbi:MAG TPA: 4a-hydroxytetrahydrobiopterin dehydratase [Tepidisphaeraceae bacterium]|nr:4a-hydroxytetrahydrobiopterin dehydratase [Tepidisphaeraceae bacterium]